MKAIHYLKKLALQEGYLDIDWYKHFAFIIPQPDSIHLDQFPIVQIDDQQLSRVLEIPFQTLTDKEEKVNDLKQKIPFIKEVITAIALGFTLEKKGYVPKIRGECLEIESHNIQSIKSYRPILRKKWFQRVKTEILVEKEFFLNQELPSWITSLDITNEVILIKGKTENKDIGEYVMNIFSKQNFIIKQIRVLISQSESMRRVSQQIQQLPLEYSQNETPIQPQMISDSIYDIIPLEDNNQNYYFEKSKTVKQNNIFFNQQMNNTEEISLQNQNYSINTMTNEKDKQSTIEACIINIQ